MDFRAYLQKLQSLPDNQKKIILWTIVVILAVVMGIFWVRSVMNRLSNLGNELGKIEFPQIDSSPLAEGERVDAPNGSSILETTTLSDQSILDSD